MENEYEICQFANKRCYTKEGAGHAINLAKKRLRKPNGKMERSKARKHRLPTRYYLCEHCNKYHLTSEYKRMGKENYEKHRRNPYDRREFKRMGTEF